MRTLELLLFPVYLYIVIILRGAQGFPIVINFLCVAFFRLREFIFQRFALCCRGTCFRLFLEDEDYQRYTQRRENQGEDVSIHHSLTNAPGELPGAELK